MTWSPDAWRRIVRGCGLVGLVLAAGGYAALQQAAPSYRPAALLAFYAGFGLVIAAIVLWYRHVPPRPPVQEEEPEEIADTDHPEGE